MHQSIVTLPALARLPGLRHAFFTRQGGTGDGLYASLNCGFGSDDAPERVEANRARAMALIGLPASALTTVHQIHSADVAVVEQPWPRAENPKADALVTDRPGVALGILAADCVPILFADAEAGVIGAAHSGWKGTRDRIGQATIEAMERLGARRQHIHAAIGPAIQQASYEVGPEFPRHFAAEGPEAEQYFAPSTRPGHFMFDLPGLVEAHLNALGLASVERSRHDTAAEPALFFSYRRATLSGEPDYGRGLSAIALTR
ncbi:laccase domain protein [Aliidongia dinghuensis]|uniref:Purine nucleoside phosphorylase n=1 Tax=Aliidongia dinghuensis TaxID=1867774 RepID=A0A8J2YQE9_9PROT|nr:peptidoglycan editing factor PgeF [Aliidongia dinghuensis]GGF08256.1 laccase domain protein [Aliidongia dinghuensis]